MNKENDYKTFYWSRGRSSCGTSNTRRRAERGRRKKRRRIATGKFHRWNRKKIPDHCRDFLITETNVLNLRSLGQ